MDNTVLKLNITPELSGRTVESLLRNELSVSHTLTKRIKLTGKVWLNGEHTFSNVRVKQGDMIELDVSDEPADDGIAPCEIRFSVLYEDEWLIVIDKPARVPVHPARSGERELCVAGMIKAYLGSDAVFHPVNRLDSGVSGAMVIAKNAYVHELLRRAMHTHEFTRTYVGICTREPCPPFGIIETNIKRTDAPSIKRVVCDAGKPACTEYETVQCANGFALVKLIPITGRTHQLRLHMAHIGSALAGDWLYGEEGSGGITRAALHSSNIHLIHPITKKAIDIACAMPSDMCALMETDSKQ